jgi:hypothetical protein
MPLSIMCIVNIHGKKIDPIYITLKFELGNVI